MITPMDRLVVVGRKGGAQEVLAALQGLGVVQVDTVDVENVTGAHRGEGAGLGRYRVSELDLSARALWDRVTVLSGALLEALAVGDDAPLASRGELPSDPEVVVERVDVVARQVEPLVAERSEARAELTTIEEFLPAFRDLAPALAQLEDSRVLHGSAVLVASDSAPFLKADLVATFGGRIAFEERARGSKATVLVAAVLRREATALSATFERLGLAEMQVPDRYRTLGLAKAVHTMEERLQVLPKRLAAIAEELRKLSLQFGPRLKAYRQMGLNRRERFERLADLAEGRFAFALAGWVPQVDRHRVSEALRKQFADELILRYRPADANGDVGVPVRLENAPWARPFQFLLTVFEPPRYGGFDPTLTLALFLPLFFGLIVGDIGYGLSFAALALLLRRRGRRGKALVLGPLGMAVSAPLLVQVSSVMLWAAGWTIVWGLVFGASFGTLLESWPQDRPVFYTTLHHDTGGGMFDIALSRVEVFEPLMILAIAFGTIQILGGWLIRVTYGVKHQEVKHIFEGIGMFAGVGSLVVVATAILTQNLNPVLVGLVVVGFAVFLVCAALARMPVMLVGLVSNSGDILSYLRLFAVGLAAALMAKLITQLGFAVAGGVPVIGPVLGIAVGLVVHLIALLPMVIVYALQSLRLQYLEFFTKFGFYEAAGRPFRPLRFLGGKP